MPACRVSTVEYRLPLDHKSTLRVCQVAHILQTITDKDERATMVSVDGVEAYDLIPRNAMMEGLLRVSRSCVCRRAAGHPTRGGETFPHCHRGCPLLHCHCCSHKVSIDLTLAEAEQGVPEQGVKILGIPARQPGLVRLFLEKKSEQKLLHKNCGGESGKNENLGRSSGWLSGGGLSG